MFAWIMDNWLLITAISGGLYVAVLILEKIVNNRKNKKVDQYKKANSTGKDVEVKDVQI